jgi:hypothetical protein
MYEQEIHVCILVGFYAAPIFTVKVMWQLRSSKGGGRPHVPLYALIQIQMGTPSRTRTTNIS